MAPITLRLARCTFRPIIHRIPAFTTRRTLRTTTFRASKKDDLMDKDSMDVQPTEHSKSGGDQQAAQSDQAFDPSTTSPEEQVGKEEGKSGADNPTEVSPGNPEVSKPKQSGENHTERSPNEAAGQRRQSSGGGSANKAGGGKSG